MSATNSEPVTRKIGKLTVSFTDRGAQFRREFDVPRSLLWEALSKAEHMPHWWGVASDTMISCELDFRPGGKWRFVTRGAEGENAFHGEIREVLAQERIVQTFEWEGAPGNVMLDAMTLAEQGDRTLMVVHSTLESGSPEAVEAMVQMGMAEGAAETYDRLEAYALTLA
jgi:uncharacterized protein YndB with AHSA1/START domain